MKKNLLTFIVTLFVGYISTAQSWQVVGQAGFSGGVGAFLFPQSLATDNNGVPYIVYSEYINAQADGIGVVKKFENNTWQTVGNVFYANFGNVSIYSSLVFSSSNVPYLTYSDNLNSDKIAVLKLDNGIWQHVGTPWISEANSRYSTLQFDTNGTPYVAYRDGANFNKITVKKFENNSWQIVGQAGFSAEEVSDYISLAFDNDNTPYVTYPEYNSNINTAALRIMKFENGSWQNLPAVGFNPLIVYNISFTIKNDILYIAYNDNNYTNHRFIVKKFENNIWQTLFDEYYANFGRIRLISVNDTPYIVFTDAQNNNKATSKKYENGSWQLVGEPGFTASTVDELSFVSGNNGTLYTAFLDYINGGITVLKYDPTLGINQNTTSTATMLFPNPATDSVTITTATAQSMVKVIDVTGKLVYSTVINNQGSIDTSVFANGVYLVQISNENQPLQIKKLVVNRN
jgi:hypothetical protein